MSGSGKKWIQQVIFLKNLTEDLPAELTALKMQDGMVI